MWQDLNETKYFFFLLLIISLITVMLSLGMYTMQAKKRKWKKRFIRSLIVFSLLASFCYQEYVTKDIPTQEKQDSFVLPSYNGKDIVVINNNIPYFSKQDLKQSSFEYYKPLDHLARAREAYALVGVETLPKDKRGSIGMVKPSGWHLSKYNFIDGKYLFNRCHLIAYELTGENANRENLITGTRQLNVVMMLPYENKIANYIKQTGNHVLYRVRPIYQKDELLARGVLMEARSIEDGGRGILFCVFCFNRQNGVDINYTNGENKAS